MAELLGEVRAALHHAVVVSPAWLSLAAHAWGVGVDGAGAGGDAAGAYGRCSIDCDGGFGRPLRCRFHTVLCARGTVWGKEEYVGA